MSNKRSGKTRTDKWLLEVSGDFEKDSLSATGGGKSQVGVSLGE